MSFEVEKRLLFCKPTIFSRTNENQFQKVLSKENDPFLSQIRNKALILPPIIYYALKPRACDPTPYFSDLELLFRPF